jgi:hypothetical protein
VQTRMVMKTIAAMNLVFVITTVLSFFFFGLINSLRRRVWSRLPKGNRV